MDWLSPWAFLAASLVGAWFTWNAWFPSRRAQPLGVHGTHDTLLSIDDARSFAARLRETSRAPVVFVELPGAQHAFELFHSPRTHRVIRGVHRFLGNIHSEHQRSRRKLEEAP